MRRYVTPLLIVDERARWMSPAHAYYLIVSDQEAVVQDDAAATVVLRRLGLNDDEITQRLEFSSGS